MVANAVCQVGLVGLAKLLKSLLRLVDLFAQPSDLGFKLSAQRGALLRHFDVKLPESSKRIDTARRSGASTPRLTHTVRLGTALLDHSEYPVAKLVVFRILGLGASADSLDQVVIGAKTVHGKDGGILSGLEVDSVFHFDVSFLLLVSKSG